MKLNHKIHIDLLEFFRTGRFDCLRLGQTKEYVLNNFPDPDGLEESNASDFVARQPAIWCYGTIELHFCDATLWLIFSDHIGEMDGGPAIELEPWILNDPGPPTLLESMRSLTRERIDFSKKEGSIGDVKLELSSGVVLHFEKACEFGSGIDWRSSVDPNEFLLSAFALSELTERSQKAGERRSGDEGGKSEAKEPRK